MIKEKSLGIQIPEKILVPMAKGGSSTKAFQIASSFAMKYNSQLTFLTIKEEVKEITWSDKIAIIMNAHREVTSKGIKSIPRIQSAKNIKEGILKEINSKPYDLTFMSHRQRKSVSTSIFGSIGDTVMKKTNKTVAMISSVGRPTHYRNIFVPITERLNTRKSVYLSVLLAHAEGARLTICDMRNFDRKKIHGFKAFMEEKPWDSLEVETDIIVKNTDGVREIAMQALYTSGADCVVLGVRPDEYHNVRINGDIKRIIKDFAEDSILVKR